jgi:glycosyltransferase involved in cell wall biosynthesis
MLVSVIIPTHNRALRVQRAITSALDQTHGSVEVIVVDDGSTDRTADRVAERFGPDDRLTLISTENRGVAGARNTGIEAASGDFVAFLDSDDEWFPWKLEFQLECLRRVPDAGLVWTDMRAVDPDGVEIAPRHIRDFYLHYGEIDIADVLDGPISVSRPEFGTARLWHGDLYTAMLGGNLIHTSTVLMTRERLAVVQSFDESLIRTGEDFDFHLRSAAAGPVAFADVPTITYRVGAPDQLTRPDLMVQMATNHLATIEKAVTADRGRTPRRDLERARAAAHGWLGEELLATGLGAEAAPHLRAAIRGPRGFRAAVLWLLTKLPERAATVVRSGLGKVTRPFRRRSAG